MICNIQLYIHHMKGIEVDISPKLPDELPKLLEANATAVKWLNENIL